MIAKLFREIPVSGQKATLVLITLGIIEYAKAKRQLPTTFSSRHFQRAHNFGRFTSVRRIRQVVDRSIAGDVFSLRPFRLDVNRIV